MVDSRRSWQRGYSFQKEIPVENLVKFHLFSGAHGSRRPTSSVQHHRVA